CSIRQRLAEAAPEIGESTDPAEPSHPIRRREWFMETLSGFDILAANEPEIGFAPLPYYAVDNPGITQTLIQVLRGRLFRAEWGTQYGRGEAPPQKVRTDLSGFELEIENVQARYTAMRQQFKLQEQRLPGPADERLRLFVDQLTPEPFLRHPDEEESEL